MFRILMLGILLICGGCAGTQYQAQVSSNYISSTNDIVITTTVVAHN